MFTRLKQRMNNFMQGRHGIDHVYITNLILYFVLLIIFRRLDLPYLEMLLLILILWTFYRVFSKNIAKRQAENRYLLRFYSKIRSKISILFKRIKDIKTHRYRRCQHCETILRLPRKLGIHTVKCPRCKRRFQVKIRL